MKNTPDEADGVKSTAGPRDFTIRMAGPDDAPVIAALVRELAVFVNYEEHAKAAPEDFRRHLFGPRPAAEAALAEIDGEPVGFALWFSTFSTFRGQPGLYLEDVFVRREHRSRGIGKALLAVVAAQAVDRGCGRVEWAVLKWNKAALGFYRSLEAQVLDEYTTCRIDEEPLRKLAGLAKKDGHAVLARDSNDE
jgi:GNAT superfamily N-acetyltransferase